ncbi:cytochrome P450 [Chitinophaga sp. Mgbs1]|uniref:Cytochrome P450 n=1 Tax=Chitinophaga solisilvae TaxID=1233460 RepID=A0A3S1CNR9_9BACT|nr:cytochrome P450 [Chitinophaga solisilvae]
MIPSIDTIDLAPWCHRMRVAHPIVYNSEYPRVHGGKGAWHLFRYHDIRYVLDHHEIFSSEFISRKNHLGNSFLATDPPRHGKLRSLVAKAFTPTAIAYLESWITSQCESLLQPLLSAGKMDFIDAFARQLPKRTILQFLGLPPEITAQLLPQEIDILGKNHSEDPGSLQLMEERISQPFYQYISQYQQGITSGHNIIAGLIDANIDGEKLTLAELLGFCIVLLSGGIETTEAFLGNAMYTLCKLPALQEYLIQHPASIPAAMEEVLRFRSPVLNFHRIARHNTIINGIEIKAGELVGLYSISANRDPEVFNNPDEFNIWRNNSISLSFGHGIHSCIGSMLARMEARIAFSVILKHMSGIGIQEDAVLSLSGSPITYDLKTLPITFRNRHIQ